MPPLTGEYKVLTWNLQWGSDGEQGITEDPAIVMPILKAHTIGLLQEVPNDKRPSKYVRLDTLKKELEESDYKCSVVKRGNYSFLTYWKKGIPLDDIPRSIRDDKKYPIAWFVSGNGFWLINVHLRTDRDGNDKKDLRKRDVRTIVNSVREKLHEKRHKPVIWLGGDFNTATVEEFTDELWPILRNGLGLEWCKNKLGTYFYKSTKEWSYEAKDFLLTNKTNDKCPKATTLFNPPENEPTPSGHFPVSTGQYQAVAFEIGGISLKAPLMFPRRSPVWSTDNVADGFISIEDKPNELSYLLSRNEKNNGNNAHRIPQRAYLRYYGKAFEILNGKTKFLCHWRHTAVDAAISHAAPDEEPVDKAKIAPIVEEVRHFMATTAKRVPEVLEDLAFIADCCEYIQNKVPEGESGLAADLLNESSKYQSLAKILREFASGMSEGAITDEAYRVIRQCSAIVDGGGPIAQRVATQLTTGRGSFALREQKLLKLNNDCHDASERPWWWQSVPLSLAEVVARLGQLAKRLRKL